jgi:hypothetical protein
MTITSNDIKEVIETKDDFGHEMRVGVYRVDIWVARPYRAAQMATRFPVRCDSLTSVGGQSGEFGLSLAIDPKT